MRHLPGIISVSERAFGIFSCILQNTKVDMDLLTTTDTGECVPPSSPPTSCANQGRSCVRFVSQCQHVVVTVDESTASDFLLFFGNPQDWPKQPFEEEVPSDSRRISQALANFQAILSCHQPFRDQSHHRHVQEKLRTLDIWAGPLSDVRTRLLEGAQVGRAPCGRCLPELLDHGSRTRSTIPRHAVCPINLRGVNVCV